MFALYNISMEEGFYESKQIKNNFKFIWRKGNKKRLGYWKEEYYFGAVVVLFAFEREQSELSTKCGTTKNEIERYAISEMIKKF